MTDPVEVIAMAIARALHGTADNETPVNLEDVARAALVALESEGYVTVLRGDIEEAKQEAWERGRASG